MEPGQVAGVPRAWAAKLLEVETRVRGDGPRITRVGSEPDETTIVSGGFEVKVDEDVEAQDPRKLHRVREKMYLYPGGNDPTGTESDSAGDAAKAFAAFQLSTALVKFPRSSLSFSFSVSLPRSFVAEMRDIVTVVKLLPPAPPLVAPSILSGAHRPKELGPVRTGTGTSGETGGRIPRDKDGEEELQLEQV